MRGELSAAIVIGGVYTRFIPACAGNSRLIERLETELAVHPRLRGELTQKSKLHSAQCGSSPLARGTHHIGIGRRVDCRFIPACAGNSLQPQKCGLRRLGSSPLARGTHSYCNKENPVNRFIPACAGNSRSYPSRTSLLAVHPRLRGELITFNRVG